ncbi:MAG: tetratricopeptide repeat protein [Elusimicrobia bacterium]|nr:tetratricopeptide repeat protein [Elusimicrobiota bacterium]
MNAVLFAVLTSLALAAPASQAKKKSPTKLDSWNSTKMEGAAILGELKVQSGDYSGARMNFGKSLTTSVEVHDPLSPVVALDLLRSAQLAASRGEVNEARGHLEILISRYPDSDYAFKGQQLLALIDRGEKVRFDDEEGVTLEPQTTSSGSKLSRVRQALQTGRWRDGLTLCREFLESNPDHELASEARLLEGLLYLAIQPAKAAPILTRVARSGPPGLRSRAAYALGAAAVSMRNCSWIEEDIPDTVPAGADKWAVAGLVWNAACDELKGRDDAAARKYRTVAESVFETPVKAYALAALAGRQDRDKDYGAALKLMDKAVSEAERFGLTDVSNAAALSRGHLLYKMRRYREAAEAYEAFAGAYPSDPNRTLALYQRGLALKWAGDSREAIRGFESLLARHPDTVYAPDARLQLGLLYGDANQTQKAVAQYRQMAEGGKDNRRESILLEAQLHYNHKRYTSAIPLYWRFLEEHPGDARRAEVGTLLLTSYWVGDRESPDFLKAAEAFPNHPIVKNLRWNLAAQAHKQGECAKAVALLEKYEMEYPDSPRKEEGLMLRGECYYDLREFQPSAQAFTELIRRFPKSARARDALFKRGLALHDAGDFEGSAASLKLIRGKDRLAQDAAYNAALAELKTGSQAKALRSLEQFATDWPKHPRVGWAYFRIGELREALGQYAGAALAYAKATENKTQALFNMGRCYERVKKKADAKKAYEGLGRRRPFDDPHRLHGLMRLALIYELENKARKATRIYSDILKYAPQGEVLELARKRLLSLSKDGSLAAGAQERLE